VSVSFMRNLRYPIYRLGMVITWVITWVITLSDCTSFITCLFLSHLIHDQIEGTRLNGLMVNMSFYIGQNDAINCHKACQGIGFGLIIAVTRP